MDIISVQIIVCMFLLMLLYLYTCVLFGFKDATKMFIEGIKPMLLIGCVYWLIIICIYYLTNL